MYKINSSSNQDIYLKSIDNIKRKNFELSRLFAHWLGLFIVLGCYKTLVMSIDSVFLLIDICILRIILLLMHKKSKF